MSRVPSDVLLDRVARRLRDDPSHVRPVLEVLADPDATVEPTAGAARSEVPQLARRLNDSRRTARLAEFTAASLGSDHVAAQLGGISRQALSQRVRGGRLIALRVGLRSYFPAWQFGADGRPASGLDRLLPDLLSLGSVLAADRLMRTPLEEEGDRSPADLLAAGEVDRAVHYVRIAGAGD